MDFVFWKVTFGDIVSILTLLVTVWIAKTVQESLTKSRYIREHFIKDTIRLKEDYISFINDIYKGKLAAKEIKDWLKFMSLSVKSLEGFVSAYYDIPKGKLIELHSEFQQFITAEDDFNNQFKEEVVSFSTETKSQFLKRQSHISDAFTRIIIEINSAKELRKKKSISLADVE